MARKTDSNGMQALRQFNGAGTCVQLLPRSGDGRFACGRSRAVKERPCASMERRCGEIRLPFPPDADTIRRVTPTSKTSAWLRCLLMAALVLPPLCAGLHRADCEYHMEVLSLMSSQETWMRQQTDPGAWIIPSWNERPRVNKPPLLVWMNLLAWADLTPESAGVDDLVLRARLLAAACSLLGLLGVVWAGAALRDVRTGALAAVVTGTTLLFLRQSRLASYDTYLLAFTSLAMASALWALQPRSGTPQRMRAVAGWLLYGLWLAAAFLVKGPIAVVHTALPLSLIAATGLRRRRDFAGLLGGLLVAAVLVAPWYLYVLQTFPEARGTLWIEYKAERPTYEMPWYYLNVIPLSSPWLLWLPAFFAWGTREFPRQRSDPAVRIVAIWFLSLFVLMSIPAAKQARYIVPILPSVGLAIALLWMRRDAGEPHWLRRLDWVHAVLLAVGAVLLGGFGATQSLWLRLGWLQWPELVGVPAWLFGVVGVLLLGIAMQVGRLLKSGRREAAAWLTALWVTVGVTPAYYGYAGSYHSRYVHRATVESIAELTHGHAFYHAKPTSRRNWKETPDPKMLLYARRTIPEWSGSAPSGSAPLFLMSTHPSEAEPAILQEGWVPVMDFKDGNRPRRLYRREK